MVIGIAVNAQIRGMIDRYLYHLGCSNTDELIVIDPCSGVAQKMLLNS